MSITATCGCGKQYSLADQFAGKKVKCKVCGQAFVVPAAVAAVSAVAAAPPKPAQAKPVPAPARVSPAKTPAPEPLALKDDAGPIGLAPDPDEKQKAANKPAAIKPSSTRTSSMKAIDSAPPLQSETPAKAQAASKPGKRDAAWESMLNQQNAALKEAESKQAAENTKRAVEEKAAAMLRAKEAERVAKSASRSSGSSISSESASQGFFADWMAAPFDSWVSVPAAFAVGLLLVAPLALISEGVGSIASVIFMVIGGIIAIIGGIRKLIAVFSNSALIGALMFVPMIGGFVGLYALITYWHDTRGPFIMSLVGSGLMLGAIVGAAVGFSGA